MLRGSALADRRDDIIGLRRRDQKMWWWWYAVCICGTLLAAVIARNTAGQPFSIAFVGLCIVIVVAIVRPVVGVYVVVFFAVLGDIKTWSWYPFTTNLSSPESILYINNKLILNPLELSQLALLAGWLLQMMSRHELTLRRGRLFWPVMALTGFVFFGFANGLSHGGNQNAALWEARHLLAIPVTYVLVTNLFDHGRQYVRLLWLIVVATFINSIMAFVYLRQQPGDFLDTTESLIAHGSTMPMNAVFILIAAAWMLKAKSQGFRFVLPVLAAPVLVVYILAQRRAAVVALIAGLLLLAIFLFWTNRRAFFRIVPVMLVLASLYTTLFWNDASSLPGFPAQAVKSVIAPDSVSERNQGSDQYRVTEKLDILATIQTSPVLGIGFGKPFLRPYPLPNIAAFLLEPYQPHNSILWIWMKTGIGGFVAMLYLFGTAMRTGARAGLRLARGDDAAVTLTCTAFILMYAVFAYVDIVWDAQNALLLALAMAQVSHALSSSGGEGPTSTATESGVTTPAAPRRLRAAVLEPVAANPVLVPSSPA